MKRTILVALVLGVLAGQAFADPFILDVPTARQFTQLNTINQYNELHLVIDYSGVPGSATYVDDGYFGTPADYGDTPMQFSVGFAGHIVKGNVIWIGKAVDGLGDADSFGIDIANDNDDAYTYHAWVSYDNLATRSVGAGVIILPDFSSFVSVPVAPTAAVTHIGFDLELVNRPSDDFHTSVVPVPAAVLLGFLGLGAAGLKLRRFA